MADMKHYVSTADVYTGGAFYRAGVPFVSDVENPSDNWEEIPAEEAAIQATATDKVPDDADLDALTKAPLQAVAFIRHVAGIGDMDADDLRTAIRASYEPAL